MTDSQKKSEIRWWLRSIIVPLGIVGIFIAWLGWRSPRHDIKTSKVVVLANAAYLRLKSFHAEADLRRPKPVSISVEVHPISIAEAVDYIPTFDDFALAFDRNVVQKVILRHGEGQRIAQIELSGEGPHSYHVIAHQHEEMGPDTRSPGNPGYSTFEGSGSIVLHNHAKYLIVVGGGTSFKDRVTMRAIN